MKENAFVSSYFEQPRTKWAAFLLGVISIALLVAIQASSSPELMETAEMIAIPP